MSDRFSRACLAVLATLGAGVLLSACGGSSPPANSAAAAEKTREQQFLKLSKCLREHGIDVSTPTGGGPIKLQGGAGSISQQKLEAARNACRKYAPAENESQTPQQRAEIEEKVQK